MKVFVSFLEKTDIGNIYNICIQVKIIKYDKKIEEGIETSLTTFTKIHTIFL